MRILIALGGNALLRSGGLVDPAAQLRSCAAAAELLAAVAAEHEVIVTHGNGPQIGLLALQSETSTEAPTFPPHVLGAESEGMLGHMLELALRNALPEREVISVLTEVVVSQDDPAFLRPSKPIGPVYSSRQAAMLTRERGWAVGRDGGGYRRLIASPEPHAISELRSLRVLVDSGALVVCAVGPGGPITVDALGMMRGAEAVVDKDLTAALLARRLGADLLMMLTDIDAVHLGWGSGQNRPLRRTDPEELRAASFAPGSIGPKVEAACRFVEASGRRAAIGALADAALIVEGGAGTQVSPRAAAPAIA